MRSSLFDDRPWPIWRAVWRRRNNKLFLPSFVAGFFLIFIGIPYGMTNRISEFIGWTAFNPSTGIDDSISYIPILNVAYFSFYAYYVLIPFFAKTDLQKKCAIVFTQRLFVVTIPIFFIFLFLPVEVDLRNEVQGDGVLTTLLNLVHNVDQPYNAWPSLHVGHSLCVVLSVPLIYNVRRGIYLSLWIAWFFLAFSTMTTQQHYFFDVATGILFACIAHYRWIKPSIERCIAKELDDAFEQLQANNVDTTSG